MASVPEAAKNAALIRVDRAAKTAYLIEKERYLEGSIP
jgi:hypothetical protein